MAGNKDEFKRDMFFGSFGVLTERTIAIALIEKLDQLWIHFKSLLRSIVLITFFVFKSKPLRICKDITNYNLMLNNIIIIITYRSLTYHILKGTKALISLILFSFLTISLYIFGIFVIH